MFTTTFTLERHIEELRAELRGVAEAEEARRIRLELEAALMMREDRSRKAEAGG